ncbi:hypothetical protein ACOR62_07405 [Neisseria lisongii]|uniref:Lipoprotein n=1 Tax=Neisseria lisongii TaxID=2912188 RepID=A0AAW5AL04_9NEIS|nr:hypothetical protein [Neisseria lisongii]MCF7530201.1 hypothetical protein [Neisseria lisongii]
MLVKKATAAVLIATLSLNGCTTVMTWSVNTPYSDTTHRHQVAKENVYAFGMTKADSEQLKKGSLVMMGERYWFAVNPDDSAKLTDVLAAKLDKQFDIVDEYVHRPLQALPVELKAAEGNDFVSEFCLRYTPQKPSETAELQRLQFKLNNAGKNTYIRCLRATGQYFAAPQQAQPDYRFQKTVPVEVYYETSEKHTDKVKLAANILSTPFTLAIDAAATVVALPLAVLGVLGSAFNR